MGATLMLDTIFSEHKHREGADAAATNVWIIFIKPSILVNNDADRDMLPLMIPQIDLRHPRSCANTIDNYKPSNMSTSIPRKSTLMHW